MGSRVAAGWLSRTAPVTWRRSLSVAALPLVVLGLLLVTGLPALYAHVTTPPDRVFMGIVLNVPDTAQYLSWARESAQAVLIENKLTPDPGAAVFVNLFWLVAGRGAALLGLDASAMLQIARLVAGAACLGALAWFTSLMATSTLERWTSFLVIALGGGLGWTLVVYKYLVGELPAPLLVYVIESNTFLTLLAFPHQAMATGLLTLILGLAALAFERDSLRLAIGAGLLAVVLGLQHGYDLLHVYVFVGLTGLVLAISARRVRPLVLVVAVCAWSAPAALYLAYLTRVDPIWRGVLAQYGNAGVYTPEPLPLLIAVGLPLILLLVTRPAVSAPLPTSARELLLLVWLVAGFLLLYVPTGFQIKMLAGWQVPLGIMATRVVLRHLAPAIERTVRHARLPMAPLLAALAITLVVPVNAYLLAWRVVDLGRHDYPFSIHRDDDAALRWLEANAAPADVVLSSLTIGQYVPSRTGSRAYLAHWAQTLDFYARRAAVARFYGDDASDAERAAFVRDQRVRFIVHGPAERALGTASPGRLDALERVFTTDQTTVYRVRAHD